MHNEFDQIQSDIAQSIAKTCGLQPDLAKFAATIAIIRIKAVMGGCTVYVPSNAIDYRNALIRQQFDGKNHQKLAKQHQMSVRNIYRIVQVLNKVKIVIKPKETT